MQFTSVGYLLFFAAVAVLYFVLPKKAQNPVLLTASIVYYCLNLSFGADNPLWKSVLPLAVLAASVLFTYAMALHMDKKSGAVRTCTAAAAIGISVAVLAFFKYSNFILPTLLGITSLGRLGLPLGISFYTFASISYLVDVYRKDIAAEKSLVQYAVFVCFFGTITSGPILRAGKILPQLKKTHSFDYLRTTAALRKALVGYFKWLAVANVLGLFTNVVFSDVRAYSGGILMLSAAVYALQLYFEFSGYSDIALASGSVLDIDLPVNFNTPYFATNFSGFWSRWHISLSNWLQDYIFMPLVWSGWQTRLPVLGKKWNSPPVLTSLFCVFLISGFWHGNTWPFVVWGLLQAVYRIGEELLHRWRRPKKRPPLPLRILKTAGVLVLWSASLVFFRIGLVKDGTISDALYMLTAQFTGLFRTDFIADVLAVASAGFYSKTIMVYAYFAFVLLVLGLGIYMDWKQCFRLKGRHISTVLFTHAAPLRWAQYWGFTALILASFIMQNGGFGGMGPTYAYF